MKNTILISFLVLLLGSVNFAGAALYKGVDSEGKTVYSDQPFEDAEKYTAPPISVMDARKAGAEKEVAAEEKPAVFKYMKFDIVSPANQQTIRNEPELAVSLKLDPGLNTEEGHSIWLLLDEKPIINNSQAMSLNIGRLVRGAHKLQAQVRDASGKIIVRTRTTIVYIHQTSAP